MFLPAASWARPLPWSCHAPAVPVANSVIWQRFIVFVLIVMAVGVARAAGTELLEALTVITAASLIAVKVTDQLVGPVIWPRSA
jgi:hypothetical protein